MTNWDELKKKANKKAVNATLPTKYEKEKAANESITKIVKESNTPIKAGSSTKYKKKNEKKVSQSSSPSIKNEKKSDTKSSVSTKTSQKNGSKANRSSNKRRLTDTQRKYQEEQFKTKAVPQAIARFTEKVINDVALAPVSIPYQIATGEKLVDMGFEPTTKSAKTGAKVGSIAGDILSYGTGYKAAEKAVGKAAGKALATKTGKKAVEKAAASKVGKKVGEKTVKKVAESATKGAITDATVGTALNLSHARGEGLEGEELAKDMALNAAFDFGVGGAIETLPIAKALVKNKSGKKALKTIADDALKTAKNTSESVEKTVNAELPTKAIKTAENGKKTASINPEEIDDDYMQYLLKEAESRPTEKSVKSIRKTTLPTKETAKEAYTTDTFGFEHWANEKKVKNTIEELNKKAKNGTLTDTDKWKAVSILAENAQELTNGVSDDLRSLQKELRTYPIKLNDVTERGIADGFNDMRKSNFGRLRFSNKGVDVDEVYNTFAEAYPGLFKGAISQDEQLAELLELVGRRENLYTNAYETMPPDELANGLYKMINNNLETKTVDYHGKLKSVNNKKLRAKITENGKKTVDLPTKASNSPSYLNSDGVAATHKVENVKLKDLVADTAKNTSDIPQSLKSQQPEIKVNSKGEEVKIAGFDVVGDNTVGIVSPGTESFQEAIEQSTGVFKRLYKAFVNATSEIDNLSKAAGNNKALNSLQAVKTANGTSDYIFKKHLVNPKGEVIDDRSFIDVFKPVSKNSELFNEYAQHLNNIDRWKQEKPLDANISAEESEKVVNEILQKHPEFANMTKEINSYWQKVTHSWLVDTGRMAENAWQAMVNKYPNYVPAFMPDKGVNIGGSRFSINAGTKAAKAGTTLKRVPIEDAMMQQVQQMVKTTRKNDLFLNVIDTLRNNPEELKRYGVVSSDRQVLDNLDFDTILSNSEKEALKEVNSKLYTISAMENGEKVTAYISADLAEAFSKIDNVIGSKNMQTFANLGKRITNAMKGAITVYNPVFSLANISRDIPSALIQTENGTMRYAKNLFKAVGEMATNGEMWNKYLAMGGKTSGYVGSNRTFKNTLLPNKNPIKGAFDNIKNILGAAGEVTESVPRFAEFLSTMETTGDLNKALKDSARVTTDFSNAGEVGKTLDAWTLYLNAGIQGLDTFAKTIKTHPLRTAARSASVITVPYALLTLYNWSNPHYQDLTDHTKQNYFILPNLAGETDDEGNAKTFIKIPLNREYGAIFGSALDVVAGYASGEINPWNGYANSVKNNFMAADPATENILAPLLINLPNNVNYAGQKIVPTNLQKVSPELQYDSSTSGLAKGISKVASNLKIPSETLRSPMKVDYLLDSYSGYYGQVGQALTDQSLQGTGEHIKGATIDPFIDRFTADPRYSSGVVSDFYNAKEEAERAYNDIRLTSGDKGQDYAVNKVYTAIQDELSELSKEEKSVLTDSTLTAREKAERSKEIREQRNEIARGATARVENAIAEYNQNPNYAVLDAQQKESYEKKYKDLGISKENYATAKQIISATDAGTDVAKAYALLENGQSVDLAIAMTSERAVEEASKYKKNGVTYDEIQKANQIVKDSGYSKSVGKAYALLDGGTDATLAEMMTSEKAVQKATWCKKAGVTPEMLDEVAAAIDTNGNGSYTKAEIITFFNHFSGFTTAQKRAIFLSLSSAKNSPY